MSTTLETVARTVDRMEEVPLTILQATVPLFLILEAVDPEPAAVLAFIRAPTGRAAVLLALVEAPAGKAALLVLFQESRRRAEFLRAELLGVQVVRSRASRVASQTEVIAALMLGGSWHVATDLQCLGPSRYRGGVVGRRSGYFLQLSMLGLGKKKKKGGKKKKKKEGRAQSFSAQPRLYI